MKLVFIKLKIIIINISLDWTGVRGSRTKQSHLINLQNFQSYICKISQSALLFVAAVQWALSRGWTCKWRGPSLGAGLVPATVRALVYRESLQTGRAHSSPHCSLWDRQDSRRCVPAALVARLVPSSLPDIRQHEAARTSYRGQFSFFPCFDLVSF